MFDLGEMHGLTAVVIVLELMTLSVQLYFYLAWPYDKRRLNYLVLLLLLIVYNLTGGFFPDPQLQWIPVVWQNVVAYGSGFLVAAYFPYYFYNAFELRSLRFHALYGTALFLLLPYLVFFVLVYPLSGNLDFAIRYGLIVPGLYAPVLLYAMFRAIRFRFRQPADELDPYAAWEVQAVYWAISPWVFLSVFSYLQVPQWVEVLFTNTGFVIIAVLFMHRSGKLERREKMRLLELLEMEEKLRADFNLTCSLAGLSNRETEVALMLCRGMTYKAIGEVLHISSRTVDTHAHRIFYKVEVKNKIELQQRLGFGN